MRLEGMNGEGVNVIDNMLATHTVMNTHCAHAASEGMAYMWSASEDLGADKNLIWLRNNSLDSELIVEYLSLSVASAAVVEIFVGTGTTPTPGTLVTGVNMRIGDGNIAPALCYHTETSVDAGAGLTLLSSHRCGATAKEIIDYKGALRLKYYSELAVNVVTDVAGSTVNILGYFIDH